MPSRHKSRQRALQILFQVDQRGQPVQDAIAAYYESLYSAESETELSPDPFMEELVGGAVAKREEIDRRIAQRSEHWRLDRMPVVDRNILRLAIYEMTELQTPPAVVIDEAIELARRFSGEESLPFINGVLDAVRRESFPNDSSAEPDQDLR
jgi:N utilization substance protein B